MIFRNIKYDPIRDISPVSQYGSVNLNEAFRNGGITSSVSAEQGDYNGIEDSESIIGKPRDVFESMRLQEFVKSRGAAKAPNNDGASEGENPSATS